MGAETVHLRSSRGRFDGACARKGVTVTDDAAEVTCWDCRHILAAIEALRDHIDRDHGVMVQLGIIADSAVKMLEHVNMDTDEDRELHARAVGALRGRLSELAAEMKEADGA